MSGPGAWLRRGKLQPRIDDSNEVKELIAQCNRGELVLRWLMRAWFVLWGTEIVLLYLAWRVA
jgi:hypothetical protein